MESQFNYEDFKRKAILGLRNGEGFSGENNVLSPLIKDVLESAMSAELDLHISEEKASGKANRKNGYTPKTMHTEHGDFELHTPRDRNSSFQPEIVSKQQTFLGDVFSEQILSMYSRGVSYRDIQAHLKQLYGTSISTGKLTEITDRILPDLEAWKSRGLSSVYAITWLDAIHYSVRENGQVVKKAVYIVLGIDMEGKKDVLGMYIGESESSKFWLSVLTDLQNRGVDDILIACMDNLTGFSQAVESIFPKTDVQLCIVHQLRNSMKYVSEKNKRPVLLGLQAIYKSPNLSGASLALDKFEEQWGEKYPLIVKSWRTNWTLLTRYFDYGKEIRRIMYTTNTVEGFNRQLRKYTKTRGVFSNDKGLEKLLYVAMKNIVSKWTGKPPYWGEVQQQLQIKFEDRCKMNQ